MHIIILAQKYVNTGFDWQHILQKMLSATAEIVVCLQTSLHFVKRHLQALFGIYACFKRKRKQGIQNIAKFHLIVLTHNKIFCAISS
jgi:hypothetical protein